MAVFSGEEKTHIGRNRYDKATYFELINNYLKSHPEFGQPTDCAKAMAFDVSKTCLTREECGGINV